MRIAICTLFGLAFFSFAQAEVLTGVVFRQNGSLAPGAVVTAAAVFKSPPRRLATKADEKGAFRIDLQRLTGAARYALAVRWESEGAEVWEVLNETGEKTTIQGQSLPSVTVRLRTGGELYGRLLQLEDDEPIANARVYLDTGEVLTTSQLGEFRVNGLPMKGHSLIPVAAGRIRQYVLFDTTLRPQAELQLRLAQGAVIKGRITDQEGQPIPGAFLTRASSGTALTLNGWDEVCDGDGSFEYGGLSSERLFYNLQANAPGYHAESISTEVHEPSQVIARNVRLRKIADVTGAAAPQASPAAAPKVNTTELPRRVVKGSVRDEMGTPIEGAEIRWGAFLWDQSVESTATDRMGQFTLENVPEGRGAILVIAGGYAPSFAAVHNQELDVVLSRGARVRGVVRGTNGNPIPDVHIIPVTQCRETGYCNLIWIDQRSTRTDNRGEFEIAAIPDTNIGFDLLKDGFSEQRNVVLKTDGSLNEIQLQAGGAIAGQVFDEKGSSVRNFNIRVRIPRERRPDEKMGGYYAGFDWYGITFTRDDGTFVLSDVGADHWMRLVVSAPGIGRAVIDRVHTRAQDQLTPPEKFPIRLQPFIPLSVRVLNADSKKPLANAYVALLEDEPYTSGGFRWGYHDLWATRTRTDAAGRAVFSQPACEDGTLIVAAPGFERRRIAWTDREEEVTVLLKPAAVLSGCVKRNDRLVREGYVQLASSNMDLYSADLAENNGLFTFAQLPAGEYELTVVDASGQRLHSDHVKLDTRDTTPKTITISSRPATGQ